MITINKIKLNKVSKKSKIYVYIFTHKQDRDIDDSFINLATETVVKTVTEVVNSVTEAATAGKKYNA